MTLPIIYKIHNKAIKAINHNKAKSVTQSAKYKTKIF